jgi:hypothetical protein
MGLSVSALTLLSSGLTFWALVLTLWLQWKAQKSPLAAGWFGDVVALLGVLIGPAELHLGPGLFLVLCDRQPLEVLQLVTAAADKRLPVVYLPAWASAASLARGRAGVQLAEFSLCGW